MKISYPTRFATEIEQLLRRIQDSNRDTLRTLGPLMAESVGQGGVIHTFGSGHSEILAREFVGRAGALVGVSPVLDPTSGFVENLVGYGTRLAERHHRLHRMEPGEFIVVISNSGKNCAPIEVALFAQNRGLKVIALTALKMAESSFLGYRSPPRAHRGGSVRRSVEVFRVHRRP